MKAQIIVLIVLGVIILLLGINILLTKGIIWVAAELFSIDWSSKFWVVFVMLVILQSIFSAAKSSSK